MTFSEKYGKLITMRIGVTSDTHIPVRGHSLPAILIQEFSNVDLILHAGDILTMDVLRELEKLAPVKAVCGNMDKPEISEHLEQKMVIEVEDVRIGLIHGSGSKIGLASRIKKEFSNNAAPANQAVDCIVYGHTHVPECRIEDNILFFNPGSPTDTVFAPYRSFGIIEVNGNKMKGILINVE
ncbi:MAG: metallophosphoesterase family protein [Candidatus Desantisbacteria bacterium]